MCHLYSCTWNQLVTLVTQQSFHLARALSDPKTLRSEIHSKYFELLVSNVLNSNNQHLVRNLRFAHIPSWYQQQLHLVHIQESARTCIISKSTLRGDKKHNGNNCYATVRCLSERNIWSSQVHTSQTTVNTNNNHCPSSSRLLIKRGGSRAVTSLTKHKNRGGSQRLNKGQMLTYC